MKPFGYITDNFLYVIRDTNSLETYELSKDVYKHMGYIVDLAIAHEVYNVWIAVNSELATRFIPSFVLDAGEDNYEIKDDIKNSELDELIPFLVTWKKQGTYNDRQTVIITIPDNFIYLWRYKDIEHITNREMVHCLKLLHDRLDVPIQITPAHSGKELLKRFNHGIRLQWLEDTDLSILPSEALDSQDIHWKLKQVESLNWYLHVFDKNASYLASGNSVQVGSGIPVHKTGIEFDKKICALWKVKFLGDSIFDGVNLPLPFYVPTIRREKTGYYYTPEVEIAVMLGYEVQVEEAWVFTERHKVFNIWANFLWDLRIELQCEYERTKQKGYKLALDTIKLIYTETIGSIGTSEKRKVTMFLRKDWRNMVISDARLKILYRIKKLLEQLTELDVKLIMVNFDALYFLSDNPSFETCIPNMLDRSTELGGFKHKYSFYWNDVKEVFNATDNPNDVAEHLNKLEREGKTLCQQTQNGKTV